MANNSLKNVFRLIEAATKELPVEKAFVADLTACIEKMDMESKRIPSKTYKPSSMQCLRNMFFQVTGASPDIERANSCLIGICESGTDRHLRLQSAVAEMKKFNMSCEYIDVETFIRQRNLDYLEIVTKTEHETKVYHTRLNLSFLCDGIIKYKGQYYILEIKTESLYKWQSREKIAEEHLSQGVAYSVAFGINQVLFLYENRDNCDKKAFILEVTDAMKYEFVIGKIEECDHYVKTFTVPPKPTNLPKKVCNYCSYKNECRKAGN